MPVEIRPMPLRHEMDLVAMHVFRTRLVWLCRYMRMSLVLSDTENCEGEGAVPPHFVPLSELPRCLCKNDTGGRRSLPFVSRRSGRMLRPPRHKDSYLVDPASSHMLVSKIKPCMCKYELIQTVKLRMAH